MALRMGLTFALLPVLLAATRCSARTWNVLEDGSGDAPTLQAGIDSAGDGDVVLVRPGTYYENINLRGKAIELRSASGPEATILDGSQGDNSVITCDSGETNATLISGFTITGGQGWEWALNNRAGGAFHLQNSCPCVEANVIKNNSAIGMYGSSSRGGAITLGGPHPCNVIVRNNVFEDNVARANGGAINIEGPCVIENNVFQNNKTVAGDGGAIYDLTGVPVLIHSNLFLQNEAADHGGALYIGRSHGGPASDVIITENVVIANAAFGRDGGLDCSGGALWLYGSGAVVQRNTIAFNSGAASEADVGGGLCLFTTNSDVLIEGNIIFRNYEGAVRTFSIAHGSVRRNMIFDNGDHDILVDASSAVTLEDNLFENPLFCLFGPDSRGELAWQSPALHSAYGILGAVETGSCGDQLKTPVRPTTWGHLKALYR
jgi:parallel beta helix pectate lyase-like protein/polymorphic membrane protein